MASARVYFEDSEEDLEILKRSESAYLKDLDFQGLLHREIVGPWSVVLLYPIYVESIDRLIIA